jgi:aspartate aminotransferase-like enzyme
LYASDRGVPFTHSSNLLAALRAAMERVDWSERFSRLSALSSWLRERLCRLGFEIVAPDACATPAVVTIVLPAGVSSAVLSAELEKAGYLVSAHSEYLRARNWIQICLMGEASRDQLAAALSALYQLCFQRASV